MSEKDKGKALSKAFAAAHIKLAASQIRDRPTELARIAEKSSREAIGSGNIFSVLPLSLIQGGKNCGICA